MTFSSCTLLLDPYIYADSMADQSSDSLTSILISRFMLNLRRAGQSTSISSESMRLSRLSGPEFAVPESRIVGNLGEDLQDFVVGYDGNAVDEDIGNPCNDEVQDVANENESRPETNVIVGSDCRETPGRVCISLVSY